MRFLKLTVAYDGTKYVGWQVQPNGMTVQQRLEEAWTAATQEQIRIIASGRTDAGVHALGQVCSVATETKLSCSTLVRALNAHGPEDISVVEVLKAPDGFHAIRDATRKTYRYKIQHGRIRNPLATNDHWYCRHPLDVAAIRNAASKLVGEHDFASFEAAGAERSSTVRFLSQLRCQEEANGSFNYLYLDLTCNGFLYNMVRNIVGTLVRVGQGREQADWVSTVLQAKDRSVAGPTAPAQGLVLLNVEYDGIEFHHETE